jgi:formylglycine-generating enzyme required for sulfatase activity
VGGKLVPIPAGTFTMGSPEDEPRRDPDETAHEVELTKAFYLGATPVTVREYRTFVTASGYQTLAERGAGMGWNAEARAWEMGAGYSWRSPGWEQADDEPVVCLASEDAVAFCEWLAEDGQPYRLPTEAEWEYACRAWTTRAFCFGPTLGADQANYDHRHPLGGESRAEGPGRTTPVGKYPANAFGLYDVHGNVWEWCNDFYDFAYYNESPRSDPRGPTDGSGRVLRGGAWCTPAWDCRAALRRCGHPFFSRYQDGATGFRLALSMHEAKPRRKRR